VVDEKPEEDEVPHVAECSAAIEEAYIADTEDCRFLMYSTRNWKGNTQRARSCSEETSRSRVRSVEMMEKQR